MKKIVLILIASLVFTSIVLSENKASIAVLPFVGNTTEALYDGEVLARIFSTALSKKNIYSVLPLTKTIDEVMKKHNIQKSGLSNTVSIAKVGKALNAKYVIAGYISVLEEKKLLDVIMLDIETLKQIASNNKEYKAIEDGIKIIPVMVEDMFGESPQKQIKLTEEDIFRVVEKYRGGKYVSEIESLLKQEINKKNNEGSTPLILASSVGYTETVKALIQRGANINLQSNEGWSALMSASIFGHTETVKALIQGGADINLRNNYGNSALISASGAGHIETVKALIQGGADINLRNNYGNSALMSASGAGYTEILQALIRGGADINLRNNERWTALTYALIFERREIVNILKSLGAR